MSLLKTRPRSRRSRVGLRRISGREGDLTARLSIESRGEIGEIAAEFNTISERIQSVVRRVKRASASGKEVGARLKGEIQESSEHLRALAGRVEGLETRIEKLNGDVQASAGAVTQISSSIDSVGELLDTANEANDKMTQAVAAMSDIESSTDEMLGLIDVINDVAARTNLLSMNAAIEAAHAGESGRGFAVVAEEIRKLAGQTSEHAKRISTTLKAETDKIKLAGEMNRAAGDSFQKITDEIREIVDAFGEMVAGINEALQRSAATGETNEENINLLDSQVGTFVV